MSVELRPLGEVCKTTSGGTPSRSKPHYFDGTIPWVKSGELPDGIVVDNSEYISDEAIGNSSAKLLPAGTLLVALYGATVGKLGILSRPAATNQAVCAIFPSEAIDTKFLFWYLLAKRPWLIGQAAGGAQPNISQGVVRSLMVPVMPLAAQREIVAEIEKQFSRLDEAVASLKRVKANLKRYKASVLKDAVEGRLVPIEAELARREGRSFETGEQLLQRILETRRSQWKGNGKYKEPLDSSTASSSSVPEGWVAATTGQLCDCIVPSRDKPKSFSGATPWLTLPDFEEDKILISSSRVGLGLSESEIAGSKAKVVPQGSVVMSCVGRFGITAVLAEDAVINQQLHAFLPNAMVMPKYLAYALRTRVTEMTAVSTATTIAYLNKENCNGVRLALPPLLEQIRIVAEVERRLSFADGSEAEADRALLRAKRLKQSLLQNAFSPSNLT